MAAGVEGLTRIAAGGRRRGRRGAGARHRKVALEVRRNEDARGMLERCEMPTGGVRVVRGGEDRRVLGEGRVFRPEGGGGRHPIVYLIPLQ